MEIRIAKNYFSEGNHYLSYQAGDSYFGFGVTDNVLNEDEKASFGNLIIMKHSRFLEINDAANKERNMFYKGYVFSKGTPKEIRDFFIENIGNTVQVLYKEGFESFETNNILNHGQDGLNQIFRIGSSTGTQKILLSIFDGENGGSEVMYSGIESYRVLF